MQKAIRAQMKARGWTITALAKAVGLKRPYLSQRLNGHAEFKTGELASVGAALGMPGWELMRLAEAEMERALADGAPTSPAPEETQSTNPAATVAAGPHTEVE